MDIYSAKVTDIYETGGRKNKIGPILVKFEHGRVNVNDFQNMSPDVSLDSEQSQPLSVALSDGKINYRSNVKSVQALNRPSPYQRTFLAVRDRSTNQMKMYEAATLYLGADVEPPATANSLLLEQEKESTKTKAEMKKHLVKQFGQAKGQRIYEQSDRMQVGLSQLDAKITEATKDLDVSALQVAGEVKSDSFLPPCNRSAKFVEQVYNIDDIVPDNIVQSIQAVTGEFLEQYPTGEAINEAVNKRALSHLFGAILTNPSVKNDPQKLAQSLYLEGMINLLKSKTKALDKGPRALLPSVLPISARERIFHTFTENKRFTPEYRDSCTCQIIILALLLNGFHIKMTDLSNTMSVRPEQLRKLVALTGATVKSDALSDEVMVMLKLPLASFDIERRAPKRKR